MPATRARLVPPGTGCRRVAVGARELAKKPLDGDEADGSGEAAKLVVGPVHLVGLDHEVREHPAEVGAP
jgi:hypothetical protein